MKIIIALFAIVAVTSANVIYSAGYAAVPAAVPVSIMNQRYTHSEWSQPSVQYTVPAVAQYQSITPGFTTVHAAAPLIAAPMVHAAPLHYGAHAAYAAPLYMKK